MRSLRSFRSSLSCVLIALVVSSSFQNALAQTCPKKNNLGARPPSDDCLANQQADPPRRDTPSGGDPVDLFTGNLVFRDLDLHSAGRGMDVDLERSYQSGYAGKTSLGFGHNHNWFQRIVVEWQWVPWPDEYEGPGKAYPYPYPEDFEPDGDHPDQFPACLGAFLYGAGTRIERFQPLVGHQWKSPNGIFSRLKSTGPSYYPFVSPHGFELRTQDGTVYTFDLVNDFTPFNNGVCRTFWLTKIVDAAGNRIDLVYRSDGVVGYSYSNLAHVVDTLGRRMDCGYDPQTLWLTSVTDFAGRTVAFEHDTDGNLTSVTSPPVPECPNGRRKLYGYGPSPAQHRIVTAIDPREVLDGSMIPYLENTYDHAGRVTHQLVGGVKDGLEAGGLHRFLYESASGPNGIAKQTLAIDANGNVALHFYTVGGMDVLGYAFTGRIDPASVGATSIAQLVLVHTNAPDPATDHLLFPTEAPLRASEPSCYITRKTFNAEGQVVSRVAPGVREIYVYDSGAADRFQQANLLLTTRFPEPDDGSEPIVTAVFYEPVYNHVRALIEPRGTSALLGGGTPDPDRYRHESVFDYQETSIAGASTAFTDMLIRWGIDLGQASMFQALAQYRGSLSDIAAGSGLGDVNGDGRVDQTSGCVLVERFPSPRVFSSITGSGMTPQTIETVRRFNSFALLTAEIDPEGNATTHEYNAESDPDGDGQSTPDPGIPGRVLDGTQGAGGGGLRRSTQRPEGVDDVFVLDTLGRPVETFDGRGLRHKTSYNALDQTIGTVSPKGYVRQFGYDANGNLVSATIDNWAPSLGSLQTPSGQEQKLHDIVHRYEYDLLDRLVTEDVQAAVASGSTPAVRLITKKRYDRIGNCVLTLLPEFVKGADDANVHARVYDERNLLFTSSRGGLPPQFAQLLAHGAITETAFVQDGGVATETWSYSGSGKPSERVDAEQHAYVTEYDVFQRVSDEIDPLGNRRHTDYDPSGNVVATSRYDSANTLLSRREQHIDEVGRVYQVDTAILPPGSILEGGLVADGMVNERTLFDANGRALQTANDNAAVSTTSYDGLGRITGRSDPAGNSTVLAYDRNNNLITRTDTDQSDSGAAPQVRVTHTFFDGEDRITAVADGLGQTTRAAYDSRGNAVFESDARGLGSVPMATLDPYGEHAGIAGLTVNGHGNTTHKTYDDADRLTVVVRDMLVDGMGGNPLDPTLAGDGVVKTVTEYDANGRVRARIDDSGNTTQYRYDALDRVVLTTKADQTAQVQEYDRNGAVKKLTESNRYVVTNVYDACGRLRDRSVVKTAGTLYGTTAEHYDYDGLDRVVHAQDDDSLVTRQYDSLSRVILESAAGTGSVACLHDGVGNLRRVTYPSQRVVEYAYDGADRLDTVVSAGSTIADYSYLGRRVERRDCPAINTRMSVTYDAVLRPLAVVNRVIGLTAFDRRDFTWDASHNKLTRAHSIRGVPQTRHVYDYDSCNRMVASARTVHFDANLDQSCAYVLDGVGNRESDASGAYSMNPALPEPADLQVNQYTTTPFDARQYDKNGNLTLAGGAQLRYDYRNQIAEHVAQGVLTTYAYDAFGRRIAKTVAGATTRYCYQGPRLCEERSASGATLATHVFGRGPDAILSSDRDTDGDGIAERYYAYSDDMGNVLGILDGAGRVMERFEYGDYGAPLAGADLAPLLASASGNRFFFSGREYDRESGLYYFRARYMDPAVGRFTARDPLGIWGDASNLGNGYTYAANNPWSYIDPNGLKCAPAHNGNCGMPGPDQGAFIALAQKVIQEFVKLLERVAGSAAAGGNTAAAKGMQAVGSAMSAASGQLAPPSFGSRDPVYFCAADGTELEDPGSDPQLELETMLAIERAFDYTHDFVNSDVPSSEELRDAYCELMESGTAPREGYSYLDFLHDNHDPGGTWSSELRYPPSGVEPSGGGAPGGAPGGDQWRPLTDQEIVLMFSGGSNHHFFPNLVTFDFVFEGVIMGPQTNADPVQAMKYFLQGADFADSLEGWSDLAGDLYDVADTYKNITDGLNETLKPR